MIKNDGLGVSLMGGANGNYAIVFEPPILQKTVEKHSQPFCHLIYLLPSRQSSEQGVRVGVFEVATDGQAAWVGWVEVMPEEAHVGRGKNRNPTDAAIEDWLDVREVLRS